MKAKIRKILEDCIVTGIESGYLRAHKHHPDPPDNHIFNEIEGAVWLEIDQYFVFDSERDLCDEVVEGFDQLEEKREWVYLTEKEMLDIVNRDGMQLAEAIEAKLKEKNA